MKNKHTDLQIGDLVNYWKGSGRCELPSGTGKINHLGKIGGQKVAWIDGCSGCIALTHIRPAIAAATVGGWG